MAIKYTRNKTTASASVRLLVSAVVGVVVGGVAGSLGASFAAVLVGWDAAIITYLGWMWLTIHGLKESDTSSFALREDPARGVADLILLAASLASLAAVVIVLVSSSGDGGTAQKAMGAGLSVFSVVLAWVLVHTIFMLRYARLYYHGSRGGVEIAGTRNPTFSDFAYLAFTVGMTFQVSDTGFKSTEFRALALRHALLSYLFGTVIVATTINLVAGLSG